MAPLGKLTGWSLPLVRKGGSMRALKGASVSEELVRDAREIKKFGGDSGRVEVVGQSVLAEPTQVVINHIPQDRRVQDVAFPQAIHLSWPNEPPLNTCPGKPHCIGLGQLHTRAEDLVDAGRSCWH